MVQLTGEALVCEPGALKDAALQSPSLLSLFIRHEQVLYAQAQQSTACMAAHDIQSRLCRWLLRARDLSGGDSLPFTQEFLAQMLGVRRTSVTAVALINEAKVLAHPASVDNVPTSGGKEDHVSMGMTSALKLRQIVENAELVLAIELLAASEGLEYRKPLKPGLGVREGHARVRELVARLTEDRSMSSDIESIAGAIRAGAFDI